MVKKALPRAEVEKLIEKGANVKEDCKSEEIKTWSFVQLRIDSKMLKNLDKSVSNRVGITRTGWILEAIHEKLKKESNA